MNNIPFLSGNQFPLDCEVMNSMQEQNTELMRFITAFLGDSFYIERGGKIVYVAYRGEVFPFRSGGTPDEFGSLRVASRDHNITTTDGNFTVLQERWVEYGYSNPMFSTRLLKRISYSDIFNKADKVREPMKKDIVIDNPMVYADGTIRIDAFSCIHIEGNIVVRNPSFLEENRYVNMYNLGDVPLAAAYFPYSDTYTQAFYAGRNGNTTHRAGTVSMRICSNGDVQLHCPNPHPVDGYFFGSGYSMRFNLSYIR